MQSAHWRPALILLLSTFPVLALAADGLVNADKQGIAIHGYDPVAYFVAGRPVRGRLDLAYKWSGATWLFSSTDNRQAFIDDADQLWPSMTDP